MKGTRNPLLYMVVLTLLGFSNCKPKGDAEKLPEVRLDERFSNADIVRNPITAKNLDPDTAPKIVFDHDKVLFDSIDQGTIVRHKFMYTNQGKSPLFINEVKGSCGCTVSDFSKEAVLPGGRGEILVTFDSETKEGQQLKTVTVYANSIPAESKLLVSGFVIKSDKLSDRIIDL
jgi:Protein of unknown function (DUF1573)